MVGWFWLAGPTNSRPKRTGGPASVLPLAAEGLLLGVAGLPARLTAAVSQWQASREVLWMMLAAERPSDSETVTRGKR